MRLRGIVMRIRSSASQLLTLRPVRKPSPDFRCGNLPSRGGADDRPLVGPVPAPEKEQALPMSSQSSINNAEAGPATRLAVSPPNPVNPHGGSATADSAALVDSYRTV